ncbi:MAG: helix-turn-helix domain-containing protein [Candidatus Omnitrophica bacterium]|jgi:putative transcriptional regulator|nr:helix-turn-helix domain-containing protein [Candidatus Omnitrophota bacterium]
MKNKDFSDLLKSIDQARKIHAGKMKPGRVSEFHPIIVTNIRKRLRVSQVKFAHIIGVSVDTLQNWEQGRRRPEGPALALLKVAEANPGAVMRALYGR